MLKTKPGRSSYVHVAYRRPFAGRKTSQSQTQNSDGRQKEVSQKGTLHQSIELWQPIDPAIWILAKARSSISETEAATEITL
jgi:hypothetical protein